MTNPEQELAAVPPQNRILLLPHCLRRSAQCQAKYDNNGLQCVECSEDCPIQHLRRAALDLGYKGVCVAPGGRLAVRYVREQKPEAVVAVACEKELEEGVHGVKDISTDPDSMPVMVIIPLTKDGCVDTEVDEQNAIRILGLGCLSAHKTPNGK